MVPGDTLTYTATYTIVATGQNIPATAALGSGAIAAATPVNAANTALAGRLGAAAAVTINNNPTYAITGPGTYTVTVRATIPWAFGVAGSDVQDNPAKTGAVSLSNFNITVTQTQP